MSSTCISCNSRTFSGASCLIICHIVSIQCILQFGFIFSLCFLIFPDHRYVSTIATLCGSISIISIVFIAFYACVLRRNFSPLTITIIELQQDSEIIQKSYSNELKLERKTGKISFNSLSVLKSPTIGFAIIDQSFCISFKMRKKTKNTLHFLRQFSLLNILFLLQLISFKIQFNSLKTFLRLINQLMKPRFQSQQFPAHMSEYYKDKETNEQTLEIVNEDTSDSVFHKKVFSICDIIGNFGDGFILVHFQGYIYLVDQHAASQKSLFLQYMINPTQKYSVDVNYTTSIPNYLRPILYEKETTIRNEGWDFTELKRKALQTEVKLSKAPLIYNKELQEEDFSFLVQKLFSEKVDEDTTYSQNERNAMATYACRNAYKVGDRLKASQMRGLLDSLYKMDAPFNCPHGRPTIASVGRVIEAKKSIGFEKQYKL